eukprot:9498740-Pyramimonas_sp.AAC.1
MSPHPPPLQGAATTLAHFRAAHSSFPSQYVDLKGDTVDLKGYSMDLKGYNMDLKGYNMDLKGYIADLKLLDSRYEARAVFEDRRHAGPQGLNPWLQEVNTPTERANLRQKGGAQGLNPWLQEVNTPTERVDLRQKGGTHPPARAGI